MLSLDRQNELREQYRALVPGWQPATERFAALVRQQLSAESRLLDIGCGRGGLVEQLDHPLRQMVGIDPDWQSLTEHRLALPRSCGLSDQLPFSAESFDVVYAAWVLEHMQSPAADFHEIARVLKPGGTFVFITPNRRHPLIQFNRLLGRIRALQAPLVNTFYGRVADDSFPAYYRANESADLQRIAADAGLTLTTLDLIPDPTYLAFTPSLFRIACQIERRISQQRKLHVVGVMTRASA